MLDGIVRDPDVIMGIYGVEDGFLWEKFLKVHAGSVGLLPHEANQLMPALLKLAVPKDLDEALNEVFFFLFFLLLFFFFSPLHTLVESHGEPP